jgi:hypothetical protein
MLLEREGQHIMDEYTKEEYQEMSYWPTADEIDDAWKETIINALCKNALETSPEHVRAFMNGNLDSFKLVREYFPSICNPGDIDKE